MFGGGYPVFIIALITAQTRRARLTKKLPMREVPCNGCKLCCQGDAIRLEAEDLAGGYQTEPHPYIPGALMLAHKPTGECIYLGEQGCSIHGRAPSLCRTADCRSVAVRINFETAQTLHAMGRLDIRVWDQGHKLLEAMEKGEPKAKNRKQARNHR